MQNHLFDELEDENKELLFIARKFESLNEPHPFQLEIKEKRMFLWLDNYFKKLLTTVLQLEYNKHLQNWKG